MGGRCSELDLHLPPNSFCSEEYGARTSILRLKTDDMYLWYAHTHGPALRTYKWVKHKTRKRNRFSGFLRAYICLVVGHYQAANFQIVAERRSFATVVLPMVLPVLTYIRSAPKFRVSRNCAVTSRAAVRMKRTRSVDVSATGRQLCGWRWHLRIARRARGESWSAGRV